MSYYENLCFGGPCGGRKRVYIHLYANTSNEDGTVESSGLVTQAIDDAMSQLVSASAIDYYEILRFKAENYDRPNVKDELNLSIESEFKDWLQNSNTTGQDLYSIIGVHHLVENFPCDVDHNGGESASCGSLAFSTGVMTWSSIYCSDDIARNAAIQEPVHQLIDESLVTGMLGSDNDEHSLGKINFYNDTTPMLTFHESEVAHRGTCSSTYNWGFTYTQNMTSCTEDAVEYCGDVCSSQNSC